MPLLNGKAFALKPAPNTDQIPNDTEVWQIRFTGELFLDYDEFFARMNLYRLPIWKCAVTEREGLTFEEALISEQKVRIVGGASASAVVKICQALHREVLRLTQFSTIGRIDGVCDYIVANLKDRYVEGEVLFVKLEDGSQSSVAVKQVKLDPEAVKLREELGTQDQEIESSEIKSYIVADTADDSRQFEVEPERLFRVRNILSKAVIRTIIKDSATKENFLGAPWIIHENLAKEFNISTIPPDDIWDAETQTFRRKKKAPPRRISGMPSQFSRPKFPIEDTELPLYVSRKAHPEMETSAVPLPKAELTVTTDILPDMLYVWSFLFVYAQPLGLFPFTFDDFERALKQDEYPLSPIIMDLHIALMKNAAEQTSSTVARLTKQGVKPKKILAKSSSKIKSDTSMVVDEPAGSADVTADSIQPHVAATEETATQPAEEEVEMNDMPFEDNQVVNMMDYSYMGMWWRWKITEETWINSLLAFLFHLATVREFPSLPDIIRILTKEEPVLDTVTGRLFLPNAAPWKNTELIDRYLNLDISHKIDILTFVITESVADSSAIRRHIDAASLEWLELRKERREFEVSKKQKIEEHKQLGKEMAPDEDAPVEEQDDQSAKKKENIVSIEDDDDELPAATDAEEESGDEETDQEEEDTEEVKELKSKLLELEANDGPRQEKMRLQTQIREIEDEIRMTKLEAARAIAREKNAKAREKRKLDSEMEKLEMRELELDRAIRTSAGCLRVKPLGMDRFWNKYWWLDGYGSGVLGVLEYGFSGSKTSTIAYGTGKIWVEGAGKLECLGHVSGGANGMLPGKRRRTAITEADRWWDPYVTLPEGVEGRLPGEGTGENWLKEGEFKYYDETEHVDELLCWLNPKGVREQILKSNLTKYYDQITHGMQKRKEDQLKITETMEQIQQQADKPHRGRPKSTKAIDTHLYYKNRWAF